MPGLPRLAACAPRWPAALSTAALALVFASQLLADAAVFGSFSSIENAQREQQRLAGLLELPVRVVPVETAAGRIFRVISAEEGDEAQARFWVQLAKLLGVQDAWYWADAPPGTTAPPVEEQVAQAQPDEPFEPAELGPTEPPRPSAPEPEQSPAPPARVVAVDEPETEEDAGTPWIAFHELTGSLGVESRWYPKSAAYPGQRSHAGGFVAEPELHLEDAAGRIFTFVPFFRYDAGDSERTHFDVREAYMLLFGDIGDSQWELRLGVDRVFWGVAESQNLVNIINQIDLIEHPNEKVRLGQPMAHVTWSGDWGALELFAMTHHRGLTYSGRRGRLRLPVVLDDDYATYESGAGKWHWDAAARYSGSFGPLELGLSAFDGTSREPYPRLALGDDGAPILAPHYVQIRQFGLDAQLIADSWLFKLESIHRRGALNILGRDEDFAAFVFGTEYSFYSVFGTAIDLGLLTEWNYDDRRSRSTNRFQNDLFFGTRIGFNDVQNAELIGGVLTDLDHHSHFVYLEFNRRLLDRWTMHLDAVVLLNVGEEDFLHASRRDSYVELGLSYSF
ncbi:MAG: hypothetical protein OXP11_12755 [Gammaproteobacteria bacterium]|nr:hypothetical protein [Gammaproteobacteria bacterium]